MLCREPLRELADGDTDKCRTGDGAGKEEATLGLGQLGIGLGHVGMELRYVGLGLGHVGIELGLVVKLGLGHVGIGLGTSPVGIHVGIGEGLREAQLDIINRGCIFSVLCPRSSSLLTAGSSAKLEQSLESKEPC